MQAIWFRDCFVVFFFLNKVQCESKYPNEKELDFGIFFHKIILAKSKRIIEWSHMRFNWNNKCLKGDVFFFCSSNSFCFFLKLQYFGRLRLHSIQKSRYKCLLLISNFTIDFASRYYSNCWSQFDFKLATTSTYITI